MRAITPLTYDEKRAVVGRFTELDKALHADGPDVMAKFTAFWTAYRGDSQAVVDEFLGLETATARLRWLRCLKLRPVGGEIEDPFWPH